MKKTSLPRFLAGAIAIAHSLSASAQENPVSAGISPAAGPQTSPVKTADEARPFFSLQGTDLRVGGLPPISFHGFASQGFLYSSSYNYLDSDTKNGSLEFTEIGLNASMNPLPHTRIAAQAFDFDVGEVGNYQPFLDYGLIEYTFTDQIGLRAGRIRRPGGIYNHIQDLDLARTSVLLPQGVYDARWREFSSSVDGGEVFGSVSLGKAGGVSYELFAGQLNLSDDGGVARSVKNVLPSGATFQGLDQPLMVGGQFWWNTPVDGLRAGALWGEMLGFGFRESIPVSNQGPSGPITASPHTEADIFLQLYSLEYIWKSWTFQGEFVLKNFDSHTDIRTFSGAVPIAFSSSPASTMPASGYLGAAYRFNRWLEVGTYYNLTYQDISRDTHGPDDFQKDLALSFRFDPKPWWIVKVEGHYIHGTNLLEDNAHNPVRDDNGWFMLALKTTVSF